MEFVINNECFYKAISDVSKAVSLNTQLPILTGIKIIANNNSLILIGSNSEIIIEEIIPVIKNGVKVLEVFETGSVVISAKYLSVMVKKLPNEIHFKVNEKQFITIKSDEIITSLTGFISEEYPNLPQIDETKYIKIQSLELIEIIKQTVFAASNSELSPVLTGINILFNENHLSFSATNSHRLAYRELETESYITGSIIVPSKSLNELIKLINKESGNIHIFITDSYILFKSETISFYSRLIHGNYPNISGLLPKDSKTELILNTNQLLKGIDRATLFASEWKNNNIQLEIKEGTKIRISSNSSELGKIEETQYLKEIKGETDLRITLNGNFMIDVLKVIKEEEIRISFGGPMRPVLIEPINNPSYFYLISPVRAN